MYDSSFNLWQSASASAQVPALSNRSASSLAMRKVELSNMYAACGTLACWASVSTRFSGAWLRSSSSSAAILVKENDGELL